MKEVSILDKRFSEFISEESIEQRITQLAEQINSEMDGREVIFLGILNGAFLFAASLFRQIKIDALISFVKLASYEGTGTTGRIKELIGWNEDLKGKTVIVIEDIVDTGGTVERVVDELKMRKAADIRIAALLFKPDAYKRNITIDYVGFNIPDNFVVGYGLDYNGHGRNLPSIYTLVNS
ncbi:MAG: hypoxanthine phosphoribosyltransferase [Bacteroidales bacterium]|jgi:hypoxanthine phosphoribosyltransferase|nr:hypoxanthine phosphoribosyltransferase [Bacteroidales bacterium]